MLPLARNSETVATSQRWAQRNTSVDVTRTSGVGDQLTLPTLQTYLVCEFMLCSLPCERNAQSDDPCQVQATNISRSTCPSRAPRSDIPNWKKIRHTSMRGDFLIPPCSGASWPSHESRGLESLCTVQVRMGSSPNSLLAVCMASLLLDDINVWK